MPYMSSERTAEIRNKIKAEFPDYKFSITNEHHSGIRITILAGPLQLLTESNSKRESVNTHWMEEHYEDYPNILAVLSKIKEIANEGNGVEVEDGDYGTVPHFYLNIEIGSWDRPYQVIPKRQPVTLNATEYKKQLASTPAAGKLAICKVNKQKNGIELYFPAKPASNVLENLKQNGFRWSRFNSCWYRTDNSLSRQVASCYADIPTEEVNHDSVLVDAQEQAAIANGNY